MSSTPENGGTAKPLALVADDDSDILALVSLGLQKAGYAVVAVEDGRKALEALRERQLDLAVVDVRMPEVDGLEVIRQIRADDRTRDMLVIALSAGVRDSNVAEGLEAGADEYMAKPFSPAKLVELVRTRMPAGRAGGSPGG
jgi:CheY-like chemotaxis protein